MSAATSGNASKFFVTRSFFSLLSVIYPPLSPLNSSKQEKCKQILMPFLFSPAYVVLSFCLNFWRKARNTHKKILSEIVIKNSSTTVTITCPYTLCKFFFSSDRVNLLSVGESQKIPCYRLAQIVFS